MDEDYTGDTEHAQENVQDIPEEAAVAVEEEGQVDTDTGGDDEPGTLDDLLDGIDPQSVKEGTFDEEEFMRQAARFAPQEGEEQQGDEGEVEPEADTGAPTQGATHTIIYRGQEVQVTPEELVNLAQKGYDYDQKVGPHQRLAMLLEQHPDLAERLSKDLIARMEGGAPQGGEGDGGGEPEESPDPYFDENFERNMERSGLKETLTRDRIVRAHTALAKQDGDSYATIKQAVANVASLMDDGDVARLADPSTGAYVRLYGRVRQQLMREGVIPGTPQNPGQPKPPQQRGGQPTQGAPRRRQAARGQSFRMPTGGRGEKQQKEMSVWDLPKADFEAMVRRAKGIE